MARFAKKRIRTLPPRGEELMRTNLKAALYVCLLLAFGITAIEATYTFAGEKDVFFVVKLAALLGTVISVIALIVTRDRKTN